MNLIELLPKTQEEKRLKTLLHYNYILIKNQQRALRQQHKAIRRKNKLINRLRQEQ